MENRERPRQEDDYWTHDELIGEMQLYRDSYLVRARLHVKPELYRQGRHEEIVPLRHPRGVRTYVQAKPYILHPDIRLTVQPSQTPTPGGEIGRVTASEVLGMRHEEIGQAQSWYYHEDRTLVIWEAFLEQRFRKADPRQDSNTAALWVWLEEDLRDRFPGARRLVTPFGDPLYDAHHYQEFLRSLGYRPVAEAVFGKTFPSQP